MHASVESVLRLVNLTASGLLAGSLGFGGSALTPGWEDELDHQTRTRRTRNSLLNAIGPTALASSVALSIGGRRSARSRRALDTVASLALAGVLAATTLVTIPISRKLDETGPADYAREDSVSMVRNWGRAHAVRRALGIGAFVCAAASSILSRNRRDR